MWNSVQMHKYVGLISTVVGTTFQKKTPTHVFDYNYAVSWSIYIFLS